MASIEVEVDIDEFSTYDIIRELRRRVTGKRIGKAEQAEIDELFLQVGGKADPIKTLDDKIKLEHFLSVFDKYNSAEVEKRLP